MQLCTQEKEGDRSWPPGSKKPVSKKKPHDKDADTNKKKSKQ